MDKIGSKILPDYQLVDGFRLCGAFSPQAFRQTINFITRPGDTFLVTYPKCGTHWTQQILFLLHHGAKPSKNAREFFGFCPFLECNGTDYADTMQSPRTMKIHLPYHLAPISPEAKYIFIARNPKDCLVSYYHHTHSDMYQFVGGQFNDYFELFINGEVDYGDYFDHVLSWYQRRNDPNVLFIYYEAMKKDLKSVIVQIAQFLGPEFVQLISDEKKLNDILYFSSFEYMKNANIDEANSTRRLVAEASSQSLSSGKDHIVAYLKAKEKPVTVGIELFRKGIVGDWRSNFTPSQNDRINQKIAIKFEGTEMLDFWEKSGCLT